LSRAVYLYQGQHDYDPTVMANRTEAQKAVMRALYDGVKGCYNSPAFSPDKRDIDGRYYENENAVPLFFTISDTQHETPHLECAKILTEKLSRDVIQAIADSVIGDGTSYGEITHVFPVSATGFRQCSAQVGQLLKEEQTVALNILYAVPCFQYGEHEDTKHELPTYWELGYAFYYEPGNDERIPNVEVHELGTESTDIRWCADQLAQLDLWTPASLYVAKKATVASAIVTRRDSWTNKDKPPLKMGKEMSYEDFYEMSGDKPGYYGKAEGKWAINEAGALELISGGEE